MAEHYTRNTESILKWCDVCRRLTKHSVSSGRLGRCTEHEAPAETKRQKAAREKREREARQPSMFS